MAKQTRARKRRYTDEFKKNAIVQYVTPPGGKTKKEVAEDLGVTSGMITKWIQKFGTSAKSVGPIGKRTRKTVHRAKFHTTDNYNNLPSEINVSDAIQFLKSAQEDVMSWIRSGQIKEPDAAHLKAMTALRMLQGKSY